LSRLADAIAVGTRWQKPERTRELLHSAALGDRSQCGQNHRNQAKLAPPGRINQHIGRFEAVTRYYALEFC
jgi:hypothetical protein